MVSNQLHLEKSSSKIEYHYSRTWRCNRRCRDSTAGSFANTNERLKAEVTELAIALGGKLMGPLAKVLGVMADLVKSLKE